MDFLCKICLEHDSNRINICDGDAHQNLWQVIQILTESQISQYSVEETDFLICHDCKQSVQGTVQLWLQLRKAQQFFSATKNEQETVSNIAIDSEGGYSDKNFNSSPDDVERHESSYDPLGKVEAVFDVELQPSNKQRSPPKRSKRLQTRDRRSRGVKDDANDYEVECQDDSDDSDSDYDDKRTKTISKQTGKRRTHKPSVKTSGKQPLIKQTEKQRCKLKQYPSQVVHAEVDRIKQTFFDNTDCIVCGFRSANSRGLSLHMTNLHKETRESWCRLCNLITENLEQHTKEHQRSILRCAFCPMSFPNTGRLVEHIRWHCRADELDVTPDENLSEENRTVSVDRVDDNTEDCKTRGQPAQFSHEEVVEAIASAQKWFDMNSECLHCEFIADHVQSLSNHMIVMHSELNANWCGSCNQMTADMNTHIRDHQHDFLKCPYCRKGYSKFEQLKEHLYSHSRLKSQSPRHICNDCSVEFAEQTALLTHECTNKKGLLRFCSTCNRRVRSLAIHRKQFHGNQLCQKDESNTLCTVCGKQFRSKYRLNVHMRIHTGEMPHKCSYCDRRFAKRTYVVTHERTHTGEKPYVCKFCGKAFAQSTVHNTHIKIHTGRTEACTVCNQRFCRPSELRIHMRKHTGEKPYICKKCGRSFQVQSQLMEHMEVHTDECKPVKQMSSTSEADDLLHTAQLVKRDDSTISTDEHTEKRACDSSPQIFPSEEHLVSHLPLQSGIVQSCLPNKVDKLLNSDVKI